MAMAMKTMNRKKKKRGTGELRIDPEIRGLLRPLSEDERGKLEASILEHGIRDPLVVWKEENILLDGHNRREIALANAINIPAHKFVALSLPSREAAITWVRTNQASRRNLTKLEMDEQLAFLFRAASEQVCQTEAAETVAAQQGVSPSKVRDAEETTKALETIDAAAPGAAEIIKGSKATAQNVKKTAQLPPKKIRKVVENTKATGKLDPKVADPKPEINPAVWRLAPAFDELAKDLKRAVSTAATLADGPAGSTGFKRQQKELAGYLKNAIAVVEGGKPHSDCKLCKGAGEIEKKTCKVCKGQGWHDTMSYKRK